MTCLRTAIAALTVLAGSSVSCGPSARSPRWTTLAFHGSIIAVPPGWNLYWGPGGDYGWRFYFENRGARASVGLLGDDLAGRPAERWLLDFNSITEESVRQSWLSRRQVAGGGTVLCARRGKDKIFAACARIPGATGPQTTAVAYVKDMHADTFEEIGALDFLAEIAAHSQGFAYKTLALPRPRL